MTHFIKIENPTPIRNEEGWTWRFLPNGNPPIRKRGLKFHHGLETSGYGLRLPAVRLALALVLAHDEQSSLQLLLDKTCVLPLQIERVFQEEVFLEKDPLE